MFGKPRKTMSNSSKFVMAEGKRVGNLPQPPMKTDSSTSTGDAESKAGKRGRQTLGTIDLKKGLR
jgi:hypothetical protein